MGSRNTGKQAVLLIQFAKAPVPGKVKTRMIPHLSAQEASELHRELLLWTASTLCTDKLGAVELWLAGQSVPEFTSLIETLGFDAQRTQSGDDLGERMANAIADGLNRHSKVVVVGSDCPAIDSEYLGCAIEALDHHQVVLGPAEDGGYVLVGANAMCSEIFRGVNWGQSTVYQETVEILTVGRISWKALGVLPDIDRPEDLPRWYQLRDDANRKV